MPKDLHSQYEGRLDLLKALAQTLARETEDTLAELPHIDRISFRVKGAKSFVDKALDSANSPPYANPLVEIEDQVAGRVIVFFISDIDDVLLRLKTVFTPIEQTHRKPPRDAEFGYESHHLISVIPPQCLPIGWNPRNDVPHTFELQVRTIFMHAYSEPQHDIAYKSHLELPPELRKELAWIAASAWGADRAYGRVRQWMLKIDAEKR